MVLFGSGMGNGNAHTNNNLPIILAGGGFKHGEHKVFPASGPGRAPLSNLFLTMLQRFGLETRKFALSSGHPSRSGTGIVCGWYWAWRWPAR